ncbi:SCO3374 family protein [Streptomyces pathocidini]|uniref:SCO3374 family protein n=1 Tax=Streptomyces pathocidini TaxID=1650571 RepID=UPI0033D62DF5
MTTALPRPRTPLDSAPTASYAPGPQAVREWYERELGWPTAPAAGQRGTELLTGVRFDALEMPSEAGFTVLRRIPGTGTGPVALDGTRMRFLVAAGGAEQLPELLEWLEWGGIGLDLLALGEGDRMPAPLPGGPEAGAQGALSAPGVPGQAGPQPVWLRPPEPGLEIEPTLPAAALWGGPAGLGGGVDRAPDLVRLVGTAATACHRARVQRAGRAQALAFS